MSGEFFIINEWLWADLSGENGDEKQNQSIRFLEVLFRKCDRIIVAKNSKFQEKEWNFSKYAYESIIKRKIAKIFFFLIRFNSKKYEEITIENYKEHNLNDINPDDRYLILTHYKTKAQIITTDDKLIEKLIEKDIPYKSRENFFREYL